MASGHHIVKYGDLVILQLEGFQAAENSDHRRLLLGSQNFCNRPCNGAALAAKNMNNNAEKLALFDGLDATNISMHCIFQIHGSLDADVTGEPVLYGASLRFQLRNSECMLMYEPDSGLLTCGYDRKSVSKSFKIKPWIKIRSEGEKMFYHDTIKIVDTEGRAVSSCGGNISLDKDPSVFCAFRILPFANLSNIDPNTLIGGDLIRICHKEELIYMTSPMNPVHIHSKVSDDSCAVVPVLEHELMGGTAMWQVEVCPFGDQSGTSEIKINGVVDRSNEVRLRHVGTNLYLRASIHGVELVPKADDCCEFLMQVVAKFGEEEADANTDTQTVTHSSCIRIVPKELPNYVVSLGRVKVRSNEAMTVLFGIIENNESLQDSFQISKVSSHDFVDFIKAKQLCQVLQGLADMTRSANSDLLNAWDFTKLLTCERITKCTKDVLFSIADKVYHKDVFLSGKETAYGSQYRNRQIVLAQMGSIKLLLRFAIYGVEIAYCAEQRNLQRDQSIREIVEVVKVAYHTLGRIIEDNVSAAIEVIQNQGLSQMVRHMTRGFEDGLDFALLALVRTLQSDESSRELLYHHLTDSMITEILEFVGNNRRKHTDMIDKFDATLSRHETKFLSTFAFEFLTAICDGEIDKICSQCKDIQIRICKQLLGIVDDDIFHPMNSIFLYQILGTTKEGANNSPDLVILVSGFAMKMPSVYLPKQLESNRQDTSNESEFYTLFRKALLNIRNKLETFNADNLLSHFPNEFRNKYENNVNRVLKCAHIKHLSQLKHVEENYFIACLNLLASLCKGRNMTTQQIVRKYVSVDHLILLLSFEHAKSTSCNLSVAVLNLLVSCFVESAFLPAVPDQKGASRSITYRSPKLTKAKNSLDYYYDECCKKVFCPATQFDKRDLDNNTTQQSSPNALSNQMFLEINAKSVNQRKTLIEYIKRTITNISDWKAKWKLVSNSVTSKITDKYEIRTKDHKDFVQQLNYECSFLRLLNTLLNRRFFANDYNTISKTLDKNASDIEEDNFLCEVTNFLLGYIREGPIHLLMRLHSHSNLSNDQLPRLFEKMFSSNARVVETQRRALNMCCENLLVILDLVQLETVEQFWTLLMDNPDFIHLIIQRYNNNGTPNPSIPSTNDDSKDSKWVSMIKEQMTQIKQKPLIWDIDSEFTAYRESIFRLLWFRDEQLQLSSLKLLRKLFHIIIDFESFLPNELLLLKIANSFQSCLIDRQRYNLLRSISDFGYALNTILFLRSTQSTIQNHKITYLIENLNGILQVFDGEEGLMKLFQQAPKVNKEEPVPTNALLKSTARRPNSWKELLKDVLIDDLRDVIGNNLDTQRALECAGVHLILIEFLQQYFDNQEYEVLNQFDPKNTQFDEKLNESAKSLTNDTRLIRNQVIDKILLFFRYLINRNEKLADNIATKSFIQLLVNLRFHSKCVLKLLLSLLSTSPCSRDIFMSSNCLESLFLDVKLCIELFIENSSVLIPIHILRSANSALRIWQLFAASSEEYTKKLSLFRSINSSGHMKNGLVYSLLRFGSETMICEMFTNFTNRRTYLRKPVDLLQGKDVDEEYSKQYYSKSKNWKPLDLCFLELHLQCVEAISMQRKYSQRAPEVEDVIKMKTILELLTVDKFEIKKAYLSLFHSILFFDGNNRSINKTLFDLLPTTVNTAILDDLFTNHVPYVFSLFYSLLQDVRLFGFILLNEKTLMFSEMSDFQFENIRLIKEYTMDTILPFVYSFVKSDTIDILLLQNYSTKFEFACEVEVSKNDGSKSMKPRTKFTSIPIILKYLLNCFSAICNYNSSISNISRNEKICFLDFTNLSELIDDLQSRIQKYEVLTRVEGNPHNMIVIPSLTKLENTQITNNSKQIKQNQTNEFEQNKQSLKILDYSRRVGRRHTTHMATSLVMFSDQDVAFAAIQLHEIAYNKYILNSSKKSLDTKNIDKATDEIEARVSGELYNLIRNYTKEDVKYSNNKKTFDFKKNNKEKNYNNNNNNITEIELMQSNHHDSYIQDYDSTKYDMNSCLFEWATGLSLSSLIKHLCEIFSSNHSQSKDLSEYTFWIAAMERLLNNIRDNNMAKMLFDEYESISISEKFIENVIINENNNEDLVQKVKRVLLKAGVAKLIVRAVGSLPPGNNNNNINNINNNINNNNEKRFDGKSVQQSSMKLGAALLFGGFRDSQNAIIEIVKSELCCEFRGSGKYFIKSLREILHRLSSHISETSFLESRVSFVEEVQVFMRFVTLLCEGHNARAQLFLNRQGGFGSINLVAEIASFAKEVTSILSNRMKKLFVDENEIPQKNCPKINNIRRKVIDYRKRLDFSDLSELCLVLHHSMETISEMIQGPCKPNQFTVARINVTQNLNALFAFFGAFQLQGLRWSSSSLHDHNNHVDLTFPLLDIQSYVHSSKKRVFPKKNDKMNKTTNEHSNLKKYLISHSSTDLLCLQDINHSHLMWFGNDPVLVLQLTNLTIHKLNDNNNNNNNNSNVFEKQTLSKNSSLKSLSTHSNNENDSTCENNSQSVIVKQKTKSKLVFHNSLSKMTLVNQGSNRSDQNIDTRGSNDEMNSSDNKLDQNKHELEEKESIQDFNELINQRYNFVRYIKRKIKFDDLESDNIYYRIHKLSAVLMQLESSCLKFANSMLEGNHMEMEQEIPRQILNDIGRDNLMCNLANYWLRFDASLENSYNNSRSDEVNIENPLLSVTSTKDVHKYPSFRMSFEYYSLCMRMVELKHSFLIPLSKDVESWKRSQGDYSLTSLSMKEDIQDSEIDEFNGNDEQILTENNNNNNNNNNSNKNKNNININNINNNEDDNDNIDNISFESSKHTLLSFNKNGTFPKCNTKIDDHVSRIELRSEEKTALITVYFPKPRGVRDHWWRSEVSEFRDELLRPTKVGQRDSVEEKVKNFINDGFKLIALLDHFMMLESLSHGDASGIGFIIVFVATSYTFWSGFSCALSVVVNLYLLSHDFSNDKATTGQWDMSHVVLKAISICHLLTCILVFLSHSIMYGMLFARLSKEQESSDNNNNNNNNYNNNNNNNQNNNNKDNGSVLLLLNNGRLFGAVTICRNLGDELVLDIFGWQFSLYYLILIAFSALGLFFNSHWFALCLMEVLKVSKLMQYVTRSLTDNIEQVLATIILGAIVIYLFVVWSMTSKDLHDEYNLNGHFGCDTLNSCFRVHLDYGILSSLDWEGTAYIPSVLGESYNFLFSFIVQIVIPGIVSGIIIDTFASLRAMREEMEEDVANTCFICNITREDFETANVSFSSHVKNDHNVWRYLWYIKYLADKEKTEYTGVEQFCYEQIYVKKNLTRWLPLKMAKSLRTLRDKHDLFTIYNKISGVTTSLEKIEQSIGQLSIQQETILKRMKFSRNSKKET